MKRTAQTAVEIFKTDVRDATMADICILVLSHHFPGTHINFDLEDDDNILRVEGYDIDSKMIVDILASLQIRCSLFLE